MNFTGVEFDKSEMLGAPQFDSDLIERDGDDNK